VRHASIEHSPERRNGVERRRNPVIPPISGSLEIGNYISGLPEIGD
jgi:hypothetical protein